MKIIIEDAQNEEVEVTIKGNITDEKVQHIIKLLKSNSLSTKVMLHDEEKEILTDVSQILYFETINRKVFAKTVENKIHCKYSLGEILDMFKNYGVTQIGKSLLVNINFVQSLEPEISGNYTITLKNSEKLVVSRFYMKEFRKVIMEV